MGQYMRIVVEYFDGNFGLVDSDRLDALIATHRITGFRRSEGWVRVPQGPLRGHRGKKYVGLERREKMN